MVMLVMMMMMAKAMIVVMIIMFPPVFFLGGHNPNPASSVREPAGGSSRLFDNFIRRAAVQHLSDPQWVCRRPHIS